MNESDTRITVGDGGFDLAGVGNWVIEHLWLFLLIAFVAFVFWLFQKGGFAEKFLDYRVRTKELDAKQLDDIRIMADIFRRTYDRDDPLLPFDDGPTDREK